MTPYVTRYFSLEEVELFRRIRTAVDHFPDIDLGFDTKRKSPVVLSCHMLARAIGKVFKLEVVDGFIYPNYEHSWVLTHEGNIIDLYPVAIIGGPILVEHKTGAGPSRRIYIKADKSEYRGRFKDRQFLKAVDLIEGELRRICFGAAA